LFEGYRERGRFPLTVDLKFFTNPALKGGVEERDWSVEMFEKRYGRPMESH